MAAGIGGEKIMNDKKYSKLTDKLFEFQRINFDVPYWFDDDPCSAEYCYECAEKILEENPNWQMDGGVSIDSDYVMFCELCSKPLAHCLTDYGAKIELIEFETCGVDLENDVCKYTLVNISGGVPISYPKRLYKLIFGGNNANI